MPECPCAPHSEGADTDGDDAVLKVPNGTLGQTLREVDLPGLHFTEASFTPHSVLPWHSHDKANFCVLVEGSYTENFRRASYCMDRFDLTFKPEGEAHKDDYGAAGARCLILEITPSWLQDLRPPHVTMEAPVHLPRRMLVELGGRLYREFHNRDDMARLALQAACIELLVHVTRAKRAERPGGPPSWLTAVREMLHDRYAEQLDLDTLADAAGVHRVHLAQRFRKTYGCTIGEYVRKLRIHQAAHDLVDSDRTLADVAVTCGFYDQSHFTRTFKRYTGLTPGDYRDRKCARLTIPVAGLGAVDGHTLS